MKHISLDIPGANRPAKPWPAQRRYRSLFLSDVHLGARGCRADRVLDFLERHDAEVIYLVGDFLDGWRPIRSRWSAVHDDVIRTLMARSRAGARIVYVPGNHDGFFRRHYGIYFDRIEVVEQAIHTAADGRRYLVVHGDCCDVFANKARWLSLAGSRVDAAVRGLNALLNRGRRALGFDDGTLITDTVATVNRLIRRWDSFEVRLSALAQAQEVEGIVCGHFHRAALHEDHGVVYANCGDWLESCTAIVEEADGRLRVLDWRGRRPALADEPLPEAEDVPGLAI
ncbi:MAG: metallophosphoesterase family protein [Amaricoccus sp.]